MDRKKLHIAVRLSTIYPGFCLVCKVPRLREAVNLAVSLYCKMGYRWVSRLVSYYLRAGKNLELL